MATDTDSQSATRYSKQLSRFQSGGSFGAALAVFAESVIEEASNYRFRALLHPLLSGLHRQSSSLIALVFSFERLME
jgi:hypothetical protein